MIHRNSLLTAILILSLGLFFVFLWLAYMIMGSPLMLSPGYFVFDQYFWLNYGPGGSFNLGFSLVQVGGILTVGLVFGFLVRRHFQRTASMQSFFMAIFFFLMCLDTLKLFIPLFSYWNYSYLFSVVTSRGIYGFRLLELFSLLALSIYALGFEYQKSNQILLGAMVISLGLMLYWPMDSQGLTASLLVKLSEEPAMFFVNLVLFLLTCGSLVISGLIHGERKKLEEAGIIALLILGRTATYFPLTYLPGMATLLLGCLFMVLSRKDDALGL